jgi:CIC family chloride channel protein
MTIDNQAHPKLLAAWVRGQVRRVMGSIVGLRPALRGNELAQIFLCAILGAVVGVLIDALHQIVLLLHVSFFNPAGDHFLSTGAGIASWRIALVPVCGGLLLGLFRLLARGRRTSEIADPIEANALLGGRMSLRDSIRLTWTTLVSNGSGASLGMEAGYTQFGAGFFSAIGQLFRLRRNDLRVFVTAGAGAAIAAAFNAPLAGAFYGFELVLGGYTARALTPVAVACVCSALVARSLSHITALFAIADGTTVQPLSYYLFVVMGVLAAGIGVLTMLSVTRVEKVLRATKVPSWLRPAIGGVVLSLAALAFPQVLGSGHGAIQFHFDHQLPWLLVAGFLLAKIFASAVSIGSGFRGGLFSSSLLLGAAFGAIFVQVAALAIPELAAERPAFMLAGMGAVAAAIIGAPMTMVFLVLEATGDFRVSVGVFLAVIVASTISRLTFGYSFATWRFHLRGLTISGAHDIGWISELTAGRLMRADPKTVADGTPLGVLRLQFPPGSAKKLFVIDRQGHYAGRIDIVDVHNPDLDDALPGLVAADLAQCAGQYLLPGDNVRVVLARFVETQNETLPVLASPTDRRPIGYLTEAFALKRYTQELERVRAAETGSELFFSGKATPE